MLCIYEIFNEIILVCSAKPYTASSALICAAHFCKWGDEGTAGGPKPQNILDTIRIFHRNLFIKKKMDEWKWIFYPNMSKAIDVAGIIFYIGRKKEESNIQNLIKKRISIKEWQYTKYNKERRDKWNKERKKRAIGIYQ